MAFTLCFPLKPEKRGSLAKQTRPEKGLVFWGFLATKSTLGVHGNPPTPSFPAEAPRQRQSAPRKLCAPRALRGSPRESTASGRGAPDRVPHKKAFSQEWENWSVLSGFLRLNNQSARFRYPSGLEAPHTSGKIRALRWAFSISPASSETVAGRRLISSSPTPRMSPSHLENPHI